MFGIFSKTLSKKKKKTTVFSLEHTQFGFFPKRVTLTRIQSTGQPGLNFKLVKLVPFQLKASEENSHRANNKNKIPQD